MAVPPYIPLWCKSNFSFLEGASHPDELVEEAHRLGLRSIALTDRDGVHGAVRAHVKARELGVQLLHGAQVTVAAPGASLAPSPVGAPRRVGLHAELPCDADDELAPMAGARRGRLRKARAPAQLDLSARSVSSSAGAPISSSIITLLVQDRHGWASLCRLLTAGRRRVAKGDSLVSWPEVCERAPGLLALWRTTGLTDDEVDAIGGPLRDAFGDRLYALAARHRDADEVPAEVVLRARAKRLGLPVVAATEVLYSPAARAGRCRTCWPACAPASPSPPPAGSSAATTSTISRRRTPSRGCGPTIPARSRAPSRSRRAAPSRSTSSATATPPSACPTAPPPASACAR